MGPDDLLLHFMSFIAPALALAIALPLLTRGLLRSTAGRMGMALQVLLLAITGSVVLAAGLWWFGHDGKMATYAALVAMSALTQWLAVRGWR